MKKFQTELFVHQSIFQRAKLRELNPPETGEGLTMSPSSLASAVEHETLREARKDLRGLSVKQGQFFELGQRWT